MKAISLHISKVFKVSLMRNSRIVKRSRNRRIQNHNQGSSVRNASVRDGYRLSPGEMSQLVVNLSRSERMSRRKKRFLLWLLVFLGGYTGLYFLQFLF